MAKDPAFLFYTGDFTTGTQFFSDEQVGKYIRLLMAQHQHGHLSEQQVLFICKSYDNEVMQKFIKDADGKYYNDRLEIEVFKRKAYSESRGNNRKTKDSKAIQPKKDKKIISKSYVNHMENENKDKNEYEKTIDSFIEMRLKIKKPITEHAMKLLRGKLKKLSGESHEKAIEILNQSIINCWQDVFELRTQNIKNGTAIVNKPIYTKPSPNPVKETREQVNARLQAQIDLEKQNG